MQDPSRGSGDSAGMQRYHVRLHAYSLGLHLLILPTNHDTPDATNSLTEFKCICRVDYGALRPKPTELCDGNYHRNKTIQCWSNGITSLYQRYMIFPMRDSFTIENGLLD